MLGLLQPVFGAAVILTIAYAFSSNRRAIRWATVAWGLGLQILFAIVVLKTPIGKAVFERLGAYITRLLGFAVAVDGTAIVRETASNAPHVQRLRMPGSFPSIATGRSRGDVTRTPTRHVSANDPLPTGNVRRGRDRGIVLADLIDPAEVRDRSTGACRRAQPGGGPRASRRCA